MAKGKKAAKPGSTIALNKRARHEYHLEERFEAGLALQGWEVKSLRAGRANIAEAHVIIRTGEAWLLGSRFEPLPAATKHQHNEPDRTRKLLLQRKELDHLVGAVERKGYTIVPLELHWTRGRAKLEIGLAKGKKAHDKRAAEKERDWTRQKHRLLKGR